MKATGIVRRIDELGRIVIPKEIRRVLSIRESDPLEIFTDKNGHIVLQKYSPLGELPTFAKSAAESLHQAGSYPTIVSDREKVVASAGTPKALVGKPIDTTLDSLMDKRQTVSVRRGDPDFAQISDEFKLDARSICVAPIISDGDLFGCVLMYSVDPNVVFGDTEIKLTNAAAGFLSRQIM